MLMMRITNSIYVCILLSARIKSAAFVEISIFRSTALCDNIDTSLRCRQAALQLWRSSKCYLFGTSDVRIRYCG
jgi:hypothetical protein